MSVSNPIKAKLIAGKPVMGIWSIISSPVIVEILALSGLDFVILDMEHGTYDVEALDRCVLACEAAGAVPLVRVPGMDSSAIQWALDVGAYGIVVPQICGYEQAEQAVRMCRFAPDGMRGYNPFTRAGRYGSFSGIADGKLCNAFGLSSIIIENESSLADLERICTLPWLDMVYIGVYDLSVALGCAGNIGDPRITQIVTDSISTIRAAGKAAGMMVRNAAEITNALALGANVLVYGVDTLVIHQAMSGAVDAFRQAQA